MSKEVKRYGMCGFQSGIVQMEDGPFVSADDYDALAEKLELAKDSSLILQAGIELERENAELKQANADLDRLASQTAALNEKAGMRVFELEQALRVLLRDIESVNPDCGLELEPAVHQARAALSQQAKP